MNAPIEAQSISSLTNLLANPPTYPRNPTHPVHKSLVLYIVRVPGSKDVFLTPSKPPTKASISLEAIQSSLYYLHVETPEDELIKSSLEEQRRSEESKDAAQPVLRKPLPPTPNVNYPSFLRPQIPSKSYPEYQPLATGLGQDTQAIRFTGRGLHIRLHNKTASLDAGVPRKLIGSRPLGPRHGSEDQAYKFDELAISPSDGSKAHKSLYQLNKTPVAWSPRFGRNDENVAPERELTGEHPQLVMKEDPQGKLDRNALRIVLIRRDPITGNQWNVGTISQTSRSARGATLGPVDLMIDTPGYNKLSRGNTSQIRNDSRLSSNIIEGKFEDFEEVPSQQSISSDTVPTVFRRSVQYRASTANDSDIVNNQIHVDDIPGPVFHRGLKKSRQAYSFLSPWQGLCTFTNGIDGKSIRCQHKLPDMNSVQSSPTTNVAELRFNLPRSILGFKDLYKSPSNPEADTLPISELLAHPSRESWRHSIQTLKTRKWSQKHNELTEGPNPNIHERNQRQSLIQSTFDASSNEETDRISLKLGREKAGGGFQGKSAKLGKLILEDEGLKMGDLVVAACMGVWWQHYTEAS